jgi:hypothetical protein
MHPAHTPETSADPVGITKVSASIALTQMNTKRFNRMKPSVYSTLKVKMDNLEEYH